MIAVVTEIYSETNCMIASVTCQDGVEPVLPGGWPYWITRISPGPESESSSLAYCAAHGSRTKPLTTSPAWDIKLGSYFFLRGCHVRLFQQTQERMEDVGCLVTLAWHHSSFL
jgi:hypothetical protein